LPVAKLEDSLTQFIEPLIALLPDERLKKVVMLAIQCILSCQTPVIAAMARAVSRWEASTWAAAKRVYRFLRNGRFDHQTLLTGLYQIARRTVEQESPDYLVVAIDPVNFEKPYTHKLEGVSTVYKSRPPDLNGDARLTHGYPAITATVVNTQVPATTYANWFSYRTADFISENWEIFQAITNTRALFEEARLRFVGDSGLDDQKVFGWLDKAEAEFVIRASHLERIVEVYNDRLDRWEREPLEDLVAFVPLQTSFRVMFTHANQTRETTLHLGWFRIRLPDTHQELWMLVAEDTDIDRTTVLLTNVPLTDLASVRSVYEDWRLRGRIEHGYRFDQEQGLDVEDMRVRTVERMRRLFALVLLAAQFVFFLDETWPPQAVRWLRQLGGKLGLAIDRDGPYILLRGLAAVWQTVATLTFLATHPFPHHAFP
jgi:hypothetical protein